MVDAGVTNAARFTLVVGAGINARRNVPGWMSLVHQAWVEVFGEAADYRSSTSKLLDNARATVMSQLGWSAAQAGKLDIPIHPFEPQFAFELLDLELREGTEAAQRITELVTTVPPRVAASDSKNALADLLAHCLYKNVSRPPTPDTISELARFVQRNHRLVRVISLNVDNLLELEVAQAEAGSDHRRFLQVISRQRHRPNAHIPSYHIHGFLPVNVLLDLPEWADGSQATTRQRFEGTGQDWEHMTEAVPESLIFTDSQYWQSVATPLSFGNFVFANALHDSSCIFIGLSMTDPNILRWLGMHAGEFRSEYAREYQQRGYQYSARRPYPRHCWIRPRADDPTDLISRLLKERGVDTRELESWNAEHVRGALDEFVREITRD